MGPSNLTSRMTFLLPEGAEILGITLTYLVPFFLL
jgi:hypothetical protein